MLLFEERIDIVMAYRKISEKNIDNVINNAAKKSISNEFTENIKIEKGYMSEDNNNAFANSTTKRKFNNERLNQDAFGGINTSGDIFPEGEGDI
jgi:hypothetical protein